jgi:hypothetical protein
MSYISEAPIGGKFRAVAHADLDTDPGLWGDADLLCVQVGAAGTLEAASATVCHGVIWTREGRKGGTDDNLIIGGRTYTVLTRGILSEMEVGASPALAAGDQVYAAASGDVVVGGAGAGAGAKYIGVMVNDSTLVLDIGLGADGTV